MLTIRAGRHTGTIKVWPDNQAATTGGGEAHPPLRALQLRGRYEFAWEPSPRTATTAAGPTRSCWRSTSPGDTAGDRQRPDPARNSFAYSRVRDLRNRAWHTYAVEITKRHISWFVDTRVMRTETRPAALSGVRYRPQFVMQATHGKRMRPSWMQADWVRYYTLQRHNARSI